MPISNDDLENHKLEVETHKLEVETRKLELEANNLKVETSSDEVSGYGTSVFWGMFAVGGVLIGAVVAILAGYLLGHFTHVRTKTVAARTVTQPARTVTQPARTVTQRVTVRSGVPPTTAVASVGGVAKAFELPNGDAFNTRDVASAINSSNVSKLRVSSTIPALGKTPPYYADTPVFSPDGATEYLIDLSSNVTAVTVATGKVLWRHDYKIADEGPNGLNYTDGVIYGTTGTYAFALSATTGKQLWRTPVIEKPGTGNGQDVDSAPGVADGKVFVATSGQVHAGLIFALDAKTGKKLWTFNTDKDAADRTGKSTASAPLPGSGGAWEAPLIADGAVYFGIGNAYRSPNEAIKTPQAFLYNDSIVALNPNTGKLKWYHQGVENDFYDWDEQISPIYVHDGGQTTVVSAGKMGFVYGFNPTTGKLLWKRSVGIHNGHDNDGKLALEGKLKLKYPYDVYPGDLGGVETNMAEANGVVFVPVVNDYQIIKNANDSFGTISIPKGTGEMVAIDVKSGKVLWDTKLPSSPYGDATVTNDLVFTTLYNGTVVAYSTKTGKMVYQAAIPKGVGSFGPISIDGSTLVTGSTIYRLGAKGLPSTTTPAATTPAATTTPAASATAPAGSIPIAANPAGQLMYSVKTLMAKAGKDTFAFTNKSSVPHNFTILKGTKVIGATPTFAKGVKTLTVTLAAGTYTFECTVPGHAAAGMKGTLTVT